MHFGVFAMLDFQYAIAFTRKVRRLSYLTQSDPGEKDKTNA